MKKNYLFLLFSFLLVTELCGSWSHPLYQINANSFSYAGAIIKNPITISLVFLLVGGLVLQWKKRFRQTIWEAIRNDDAKIVHYHLKKNPKIIYTYNDACNTPLHFAAACDKPNIMKILLHYGSFIDVQIENGGTPLHRAVEHRNYNAIKYLIARGADINVSSNFVGSPLKKARQIDQGLRNNKMEELLNCEVAKAVQRIEF